MPTFWVNGSSVYTLVSGSWTESQTKAVAMGGNLATVSSTAENDFLWTTIAKPNLATSPFGIWIGLNDVAEEGTWVWASGEPVTYTNWAGGQPDNWQNEDWVHFWGYTEGAWNDLRDTSSDGVNLGIVELTPAVPGSFSGTDGDDTIWGDAAANRLAGGLGNDRLHGGLGKDTLEGGDGLDTLRGYAGGDRLEGGGGRDVLFGGRGNDVLAGGTGNDRLAGGLGADVFDFALADFEGKDTILDWEAGVDAIRIEGGDFAAIGLASADGGASTLVTLASGTTILMAGVAFGTIGEGDFLFA